MNGDSERKEEIVEAILKVLDKKRVDIPKEDLIKSVEIPPSPEFGDYAFPCFILTSKLKQDPEQIAIDLRAEMDLKSLEAFSDVQTRGSYINFFLDREKLAEELMQDILSKKDSFGGSEVGKGKTIMIEFSQPNTHKAFHVGHIRGTSIGESLSRIFEFSGVKVVRANYQGDSGMHVAKWIWCYKKFHPRERLKDDESWIASIYVDAVKRLEKKKSFREEVDEINRKLYLGEDKELNELWKKTRKMSLKAFERIYRQLNTHFDVYYFEKNFEKRGKEIVDSLLKNKIAKRSQGAIIMDLKKYNLGVWVLIRKDGTVLYSAKDLALVEKKFHDYKLDLSINVVADEQNLHFKQLFKTLSITKFPYADKCKHVSFAPVRFPNRKMSSRTGENVLYSDFFEDVKAYAKKQIRKREPRITKRDLERRATRISVAAIKYDMLKQDEKKVIVFDVKESLSFEGNSGPYILYSYARANSILKKSAFKGNPKVQDLEEKEIELIKKISEFPDVVARSYILLSPSVVANYSYHLAQVFNEFYHSCPVVNSEKENFRVALVKSFMQVLRNSVSLLGIKVLDEM